jgi:hypothetical protein
MAQQTVSAGSRIFALYRCRHLVFLEKSPALAGPVSDASKRLRDHIDG